MTEQTDFLKSLGRRVLITTFVLDMLRFLHSPNGLFSFSMDKGEIEVYMGEKYVKIWL